MWASFEGVKIHGRGTDEVEIQAISTLRELFVKAPGKPIRAMEFDSGGYGYMTKDKEIYVSRNPLSSPEAQKAGLEKYLSQLSEKSRNYKLLKGHLDVLESGDLSEFHSAYSFPESRRVEAAVRHEYGHAFHEQHIYGNGEVPGLGNKYGGLRGWQKDFGVTGRAMDNWGECVAENFALWSVDQPINPKLQTQFDSLAGKK
jgi:hypothetical protein